MRPAGRFSARGTLFNKLASHAASFVMNMNGLLRIINNTTNSLLRSYVSIILLNPGAITISRFMSSSLGSKKLYEMASVLAAFDKLEKLVYKKPLPVFL